MKSLILLLCLTCFVPSVVSAQWYRHKSEAKIAAMTPAERIDEIIKESVHDHFGSEENHYFLVQKYVWRDGLKALPRLIEIINEYDPTHSFGRRGGKARRFDAARGVLYDLDNHVVRLRASEEGRRALDALGRAIERMRTAGYAIKKDGFDWNNSTFNIVVRDFENAKKFNSIDNAIKDTFRLQYKIILSDAELLEVTNFLIVQYPVYPGWSETEALQDYTQINEGETAPWIRTLKKPERYYEAYKEFKKSKPQQ